MIYGRKLNCNSERNEAYQEIEFMYNNYLRTMKFQMYQDEITKQLLFKIAANVPRFEIQEISLQGSFNTDVYDIEYTETLSLQMMGDDGMRVFKSDRPINDYVRFIYLFFEV